jgi:hypothetical protein
MESDPAPLRLAELSHDTVMARLARDPRLLLPVGGFGHDGPLPLGWRSLLVSRMADDCSAVLGWLRAPTVAFGTAGGDARRRTPWSTRPRSLQRWLNDLLANAESLGVREVLVLTARANETQLDALATLHARSADVRVIDILPIGALAGSHEEDTAALTRIVYRLTESPSGPLQDTAYARLQTRVISALEAHRRAAPSPGGSR